MIDKRIIRVAGSNILSLEKAMIAHSAAVNSRIVCDNQLSGRVVSIANDESFSVFAITGRTIVQGINSEYAVFNDYLTACSAKLIINRRNSDIELCKVSLRCAGRAVRTKR